MAESFLSSLFICKAKVCLVLSNLTNAFSSKLGTLSHKDRAHKPWIFMCLCRERQGRGWLVQKALVRQWNLNTEFELDWETRIFHAYHWILAFTHLPSLGHGSIWTCGWIVKKLSCQCTKSILYPSILNCAFKAFWPSDTISFPKLIIRKEPQQNTLTPFPTCVTLSWSLYWAGYKFFGCTWPWCSSGSWPCVSCLTMETLGWDPLSQRQCLLGSMQKQCFAL